MNKADIKEKYGTYCDTDALVDEIMSLLTKYRHNNTEHGVCTLLNTYFENKKEMIELFSKSQNYIGNLRIMFDIELERENSSNDVYNFCSCFSDKVNAKQAILKYHDQDGKTITDYLRIGLSQIKAKDLKDNCVRESLDLNTEKRNRFTIDTGCTVESGLLLSTFNNAMYEFARHYQKELGEDIISHLTETCKIDEKFAPTMKTSRAFNRVCCHFGVDQLPKYNKLFAEYSDMVSGLKRKMKFYISLNPMDYLTMSFGHSWASCHTIDKRNIRNMPNNYSGAYCGGTLSYMLDKTSFVTFVLQSNSENPSEDGKIYRNMFHYGNDMLVQGRVYPQGNDGNTDLYKVFRGFVQKEMASLLEVDNTWIKSSTRPSTVVCSSGVHYKDYEQFSYCNVSHHKSKQLDGSCIEIGHSGVCVNCGREINISSNIVCAYCN